MEIFTYKSYQGSIEISIEDDVLHGKILFINDLITYEATTVKKLRQEFEVAVDDYLKTCKQRNIKPDKPMTGQFNVRVGEDLHKQATLYSLKSNTSLNNVVVEALHAYLKKPQRPSARHS
jgi:predicted HicB family RNase H-like nuclease